MPFTATNIAARPEPQNKVTFNEDFFVCASEEIFMSLLKVAVRILSRVNMFEYLWKSGAMLPIFRDESEMANAIF